MVSLYGEMQASRLCAKHPIYTSGRIINKALYNSHPDPLFTTYKILKLGDLHEYQAALLVNDYFMGRLPHSFCDLFIFNCDVEETYLTRQSSLIKIECYDSAFSAKCPIYKFPCIWNKWTSIVPNFTSKCQFKNEVKKKLLFSYPATVR